MISLFGKKSSDKNKMKIMLMTDMHGENPREAIDREQKDTKLDKIVFLGDYDTPEVVRDLRKIKTKKNFVVGNHELHYIFGLEIRGTLMKGSWKDYVALWKRNPREYGFMEDLMIYGNGFILEDILEDKRKIAYCHGGIVDSDSPDSDAPGYVWQRMYSEENLVANFAKMIEKKYCVLFRGHDHCSAVASLDKKTGKVTTPVGERVKLAKNKRHIVSVGAFYHGDYALFDSQTRYVDFKNTEEGHRLKGI